MGYAVAMRMHITLDDELVADLDARVKARSRSRFIAEAVRRALDDVRRRELIEAAIGSFSDSGHDWDEDPAAYIHAARRTDTRTRR